ncbi:hypothetical protein ACFQ2M_42020 [Kitasatospora saccharophila]|uniref:hypothetical protein n=1 Tax=Kitasatospora saccharophila TaxID=407973 RepID=UPI00364095F6
MLVEGRAAAGEGAPAGPRRSRGRRRIPRGETGARTGDILLPPSDFPLDEQQAQLLEVAAELHRQTRIFLLQLDRATRNADPDLLRSAGADMRAAAYVLSARHRELVGHLLERHPLAPSAPAGQAATPGDAPRGETADVERTAAAVGAELLAAAAPDGGGTCPAGSRPAVLVESPRGETVPLAAGPEGAQGTWTPGVAPRGETHTRPAGPTPSPAAPRGETPAASGTGRAAPAQAGERLRSLVDQRLAQQGSGARAALAPATAPSAAPAVGAEEPAATVSVPRDPRLRGLPRDMDVSIPLEERTFGYNWQLAGWTVQPDVLVVLGEGYQVGWVERGLDGGDGWVAVYEGYFLGDAATQQAALHDTPEQAARIIHQAHVHNL